jgi:hypothetical protein
LKIEFLGMEDCPNTPQMWISLRAALKELKWTQLIERLDLIVLSKKQDRRAGFGSPTILVNGKDIFGSPFPESYDPSCRFYRGGVPGTKEIVAELKSLANNQGGAA